MKDKILLVGPFPPTVGGITVCMENIQNSDLKKKFQFIQFTTTRPTKNLVKNVYDYSLFFHVGLKYLTASMLVTCQHIMIFPFVILHEKPKIIHVHTPDYLPFWESSIYVFVSRLLRKKVLLHIHATNFDKFFSDGNNVTKLLITKILASVDNVIVLSRRRKTFFSAIAPTAKLAVIPNTVRLRNNIKQCQSSQIKVLFIGGTEAKRKGVYDLIKAIPLVASSRDIEKPNFLIVGKCDTEKLMFICNTTKIGDFVTFLGFINNEEKNKLLASADIYVLPSYSEELPIAILEAMAAGLPIISTPVGSIPEIVQQGVNGYLIKPGDYKDLASRIIELAGNPEMRMKMGQINCKKIHNEYSESAVFGELEKIYSNLCSNRT